MRQLLTGARVHRCGDCLPLGDPLRPEETVLGLWLIFIFICSQFHLSAMCTIQSGAVKFNCNELLALMSRKYKRVGALISIIMANGGQLISSPVLFCAIAIAPLALALSSMQLVDRFVHAIGHHWQSFNWQFNCSQLTRRHRLPLSSKCTINRWPVPVTSILIWI